MATARTLIKRAFRSIGAVDAEEPLDASQATDALDTLNAMMAEWYEAQIGLPHYNFTSLDDTLGSDEADANAIAWQLAIRLAPEYGFEPSQTLFSLAEQAMGRLRLRYFQPGTVPVGDLPQSTENLLYNVETDL